MSPSPLCACSLLLGFPAAWALASLTPELSTTRSGQCSSKLEDEMSLVQMSDPSAGLRQQGGIRSAADEISLVLRSPVESCDNVEGTKQSLGSYSGKHEVFEWTNGKYFITPTERHTQFDPVSPGDEVFMCTARASGGWGVPKADCCNCNAGDPVSATRATMFKPGKTAYHCYYDCKAVACPATTTMMPLTTTRAPEVTGDPHVTNLDGVRFNLIRTGTHELLRLPRETVSGGGPPPLLQVLGRVKQERDCADAYVKELLISGTWLQESGRLSFRTAGNESQSEGAIWLKVHGSNISVDDLRSDSRLTSIIEEVTVPSVSKSKADENKISRLNFLTVKLRFPSAALTVKWLRRQVPGSSVNHLNLKISGLPTNKTMDIGGVLGHDDHTLATTPTHDCMPAAANLFSPADPGSRGRITPQAQSDSDTDWLIASYENISIDS